MRRPRGVMGAGLLLAGLLVWAGAPGPPLPPPPSTQAADDEPPPNPFGPRVSERVDALPGYLELSDGQLAVGKVYTTRDKDIRLFDRQSKRFVSIPLRSVARIEAHLDWAREEPEWRWKEEGNDDKLYSGRSYPVLKVYYTFTLIDGQAFTGDPQTQPLYVADDKGQERFILWQRHKGEMGQTLADITYIKAVHLGDEALKRGLALLEKEPDRRYRKREPVIAERPPVFVADPEDQTVHRHTCRRTMKIPLPVGFLTLADALKAGYSLCAECRPEPYSATASRPATQPAGGG